jgi:hypothetical protein
MIRKGQLQAEANCAQAQQFHSLAGLNQSIFLDSIRPLRKFTTEPMCITSSEQSHTKAQFTSPQAKFRVNLTPS